MQIPVLDLQIHKPTRGSLAWYGAVGTMAAVGIVEWPLAAVVAAGHLVAENTRSPAAEGAAEGAESASG